MTDISGSEVDPTIVDARFFPLVCEKLGECPIRAVCMRAGPCLYDRAPDLVPIVQDAIARAAFNGYTRGMRHGGIDTLTGLESLKHGDGKQLAMRTFTSMVQDARGATSEMIDSRRRVPNAIGVLFCDGDGFGQVNKLYGHDMGDEVIKFIAFCLQRQEDLLFRNGGDEFAILQARYIDRETYKRDEAGFRSELAEAMSDRLHQVIGRSWAVEKDAIEVALQLGQEPSEKSRFSKLILLEIERGISLMPHLTIGFDVRLIEEMPEVLSGDYVSRELDSLLARASVHMSSRKPAKDQSRVEAIDRVIAEQPSV